MQPYQTFEKGKKIPYLIFRKGKNLKITRFGFPTSFHSTSFDGANGSISLVNSSNLIMSFVRPSLVSSYNLWCNLPYVMGHLSLFLYSLDFVLGFKTPSTYKHLFLYIMGTKSSFFHKSIFVILNFPSSFFFFPFFGAASRRFDGDAIIFFGIFLDAGWKSLSSLPFPLPVLYVHPA